MSRQSRATMHEKRSIGEAVLAMRLWAALQHELAQTTDENARYLTRQIAKKDKCHILAAPRIPVRWNYPSAT